MKLPFTKGWTFPGLPPLTSAEGRILEALADTVFPPEAGLPISGREAHVVAYLEEMLAHLGVREQILLRGMFLAFELQSLATHPRALSLFTGLTPEQREESLRAWDESPYYFARLFFQGLKGVMLWAYVDNAEVGEAMGITPSDEILRARREQQQEAGAGDASEPSGAPAPTPTKAKR